MPEVNSVWEDNGVQGRSEVNVSYHSLQEDGHIGSKVIMAANRLSRKEILDAIKVIVIDAETYIIICAQMTTDEFHKPQDQEPLSL